MCGERVRRCRAACRAQGGAGHPPPARAHGGIPPFAALLTFPSGGRRGATGPGGDPRISWNWSVDRTAVVALLIGSGAARSPRRLGRSLPGLVMILIMHNRLNRYRPSIPRYAPTRGTFGSWADRRTASQRPAGRPWRRRAGYLSRQLTAPRPAPYPHRARRMRYGTFAGSGDACSCIRIRATGVRVDC
jgi:hypothetical protein